MYENVKKLWPEIEWIEDSELKEKVYKAWDYAIKESVLSEKDLEEIPFTLLIPNCKVSFMAHKRCVVHLCEKAAEIMPQFFKEELPINKDYLRAGAILIDIGKLLEYDLQDGKLTVSSTGKLLRHPFTGVAIAKMFDLPDEVCHIIAYHSKEGDLAKRSPEAYIAFHADFMAYEPFKSL